MKRILVVLAAVLTLLTAACTGSPSSSPAQSATAAKAKLVLGLTYTPDIQFSPFYVAQEKGYFAAEGLDVTLRHHGASEPLLGALQSGNEDVVYAGGDEMMQARSQGVPAVSFATLYQKYPVALITKNDSPITKPADLAGKKIGVPGPYGESWFGLLALLRSAGLTQQQVEVKNIGYTQQAALTSGQVDAVMGYANNDAVRFESAGIGVRTLPISDFNAPLIGVGLGATETTLRQRPDDLVKIMRAVRQAVSDIAADPQLAVDLSVKQVPGLTAEPQKKSALATMKATVPLFGDTKTVGAQDKAKWEAMATFMNDAGLLAKPVPAGEAYTDQTVSKLN